MNLFSGGAIQTFSSTVLVLPFLFFEEINITWNFEFTIALLYMAVGVSIGALSLLYVIAIFQSSFRVSSSKYFLKLH